MFINLIYNFYILFLSYLNRYGINVLEIKRMPKGMYNLILCTYNPKEKAPFFLKVESTCNIQLQKIK